MTIEFVLVLPFFLFLIFLLIGMATMFSFRQALSQAATEGARAAAVQPLDATDAARTSDALAAINGTLGAQADVTCSSGVLKRRGVTAGTCSVSAPAPCDGDKKCVTVRLSYGYRDHQLAGSMPFVPDALFPSSLTYVSSARVAQ
ncbi:MAG: TadE/TadG family type IV pilus assembly protein [Aeromicrobium sp.]